MPVFHPPGYRLCTDPACAKTRLGGYTNRHLHLTDEEPVATPEPDLDIRTNTLGDQVETTDEEWLISGVEQYEVVPPGGPGNWRTIRHYLHVSGPASDHDLPLDSAGWLRLAHLALQALSNT